MKQNKMDSTRTERITVRTSITEKNVIENNASKKDLSTSAYMRQKALADNDSVLEQIPNYIDIWNLSNDIYHVVERHGDEQLMQNIKNILDHSLNLSKETDTNE